MVQVAVVQGVLQLLGRSGCYGRRRYQVVLGRQVSALRITELAPVGILLQQRLLLREALPPWKVLAFMLVMAGLALGVMWPQLTKRMKR